MPVLKQYNAAAGVWQAVGGMGLPQTPVSFSAHKNGVDQTLAPNVYTKVTFSSVDKNVGSCYDTVNSTFRPATPGLYLLVAGLRFINIPDGKSIVAEIFKNGTDYKLTRMTTGVSDYASSEVTCLVYLNGTTDYIEVYGSHNNGSSINIDGATYASFFQACLIPDSYDSTKQIIDLTSATSDYLLGVGETAKITYTSATSVPLHIATQEGLYEFTISGNLSTTVANDNNISVLPNNTTYSAQFTEVGYKISSGNSSAIVLDASTNQFNTAWSNAVSANLSISTKTTAKTLQGTVLNKRVNGTTEHFTISSFWNDTSTAWTSLGTITFPFAQSGIIVIKRIA